MAGVYIHIPFCRQACHYCNFHFATSLRYKNVLIKSIIREIGITEPFGPDQEAGKIQTIYFGGGTPSLLEPEEISSILSAIRNKFIVDEKAEITFEANPDDINSHSLKLWKELGANRLSVGVQSFQQDELAWMNRAHNATQAMQCLDLIPEAGFNDYSIDLIYGSPLLTDEQWQQHVQILHDKKVPHISCYALTIEPKTPLHKQVTSQKKQPVDPEKQGRQFLQLVKWMQEAGYEHYEISNFSLPGKHSKHNSSYWKGTPYYGFGPSAHSFDGRFTRRWNISNNPQYISSLENNQIPFEEEMLTVNDQINEYIMTALRTSEGIHEHTIKERFGAEHVSRIRQLSRPFLEQGKLIFEGNHWKLTSEGKLFADGIAADFFV